MTAPAGPAAAIAIAAKYIARAVTAIGGRNSTVTASSSNAKKAVAYGSAAVSVDAADN